MATIALNHITKSFGRRKVIAVNDVSLEIPSDHFVVLLGPSGCGKSTTLRMIAGLEKPDQGEIRINDRVVNDVHFFEFFCPRVSGARSSCRV